MLAGCVPWPDEFAATYRAKGYWEDTSIPHLFEKMATEAPDRVAVIQGDLRATLADLWAESGRFAAHFDCLGLAKGQRVVFQLPNATVFFSAFLGLLRIGVIPVMALTAHRETELIHFARFSDATALFVPAQIREFDFRPMAETVRNAVSSLRHVFVLGEALEGQISLNALAATPSGKDDGSSDIADLDPGDVALMLLSGGTTALPKLIPRTHNDYLYNFKQSARIAGFGPDTVLLAVLPLAHNYTLGSPGALGALAHGGRVVISPKIDCETVFALVDREAVTIIPAAVPLIVN
ncbi:MAG: AMP-binding protein, partial [Rhodoplanes sp.]